MIVHTSFAQHRSPLAAGALRVLAHELTAGPTVHVFRVSNLSAAEVDGSAAMLSTDEQARAARFRFDRDRHVFVTARAALRRLLAACTDVAPTQLMFNYNAFGKPALAGAPLDFNVSHSDGAVAIALCRAGRIGVDIERVAAERAALDAAHRYFSPSEWCALQAHAPETRHEAFFVLWTLKEAFVKANEQGLSIPLDSFSITVSADAAAIHLQSARADDVRRWQFATRTAFSTFRWSVALEIAADTQCRLHVIQYC